MIAVVFVTPWTIVVVVIAVTPWIAAVTALVAADYQWMTDC